MKLVQDTLAVLDIPVYAGAWHGEYEGDDPPDKYIVYTCLNKEIAHEDDRSTSLRVTVYLSLWEKGDPTGDIRRIRSAMRAGGFAMKQERDSFEADTGYRLVSCTYVIEVEE